jgi:hypothetical protein
MDIRPIAMQLYKRKLGFIVQLANNEATSNLLREKRHSTLKDVIESLDVDLESTHEYIGCLTKACRDKLKEIYHIETLIKDSRLVKAIRYLINNASLSNYDTLSYLLDPRTYNMVTVSPYR